jgi:hypothetical protein
MEGDVILDKKRNTEGAMPAIRAVLDPANARPMGMATYFCAATTNFFLPGLYV